MRNTGTTGKPELMKKMNLMLIYKALIRLGTATRAEIAGETQISVTTVRVLLEELLEAEEITEMELDASSGGRRPLRYCLNSEKNLILVLYFEEGQIVYQLNDLLGTVIETGTEAIAEMESGELPIAERVIRFIAAYREEREICGLGLGVPGIVEEGRYYVSGGFKQWVINNIGERIEQAFHMPVILENDLNCIAIGFAIHRVNAHPGCDMDSVNIAYIHFNRDCTGAGLISAGRVVHGARQFAGELGFLPLEENRTLDEVLEAATESREIVGAVARAITIVNCVTNPSLIVIGGQRIEDGAINADQVKIQTDRYISSVLQPEIAVSCDARQDYLTGLSHLTLQRLIQELPLYEKTMGEKAMKGKTGHEKGNSKKNEEGELS